MRGLALVLGVGLCAAACGGRSQRGQDAPVGPVAGSPGSAGSHSLPATEACLGLRSETDEPTVRRAVSAKLGLELPAGFLDSSDSDAFARGERLIEAVERAFEAEALPAESLRLLRAVVGDLVAEVELPLPGDLPADEQALQQQELDRFAEHWAVEQRGGLGWLLSGAAPGAVARPPEQFAGIMTLGALLARMPSPPQRAMYLAETLACTVVPPPPPVTQSVWEQEPKQPAKRIVQQTYNDGQTPCVTCHTHYIGYAIALDRYDELGRYRQSLGGLPIDTGYSLTMPTFEPKPGPNDGRVTEFASPSELGRALSQSNGVRACMIRQLNEKLAGSALSDEELACLLDDWEAEPGSFVRLLALLAPRYAVAP